MIFTVGLLAIIAIIFPLIVIPCSQLFTTACFFEQLDKFQTLITGVIGFGGLIIAALYVGEQDRAKEERAEDRHARNLANALSLEARELSVELGYRGVGYEQMLAALVEQDAPANEVAARFKERFQEAVQPPDTLLERMSPEELSKLGWNAYASARVTRLGLRRLRFRAGDAPTGETTREAATRFLNDMSDGSFRCAVNCQRLTEIMDVVLVQGVAAADRLPLVRSATDDDANVEKNTYLKKRTSETKAAQAPKTGR